MRGVQLWPVFSYYQALSSSLVWEERVGSLLMLSWALLRCAPLSFPFTLFSLSPVLHMCRIYYFCGGNSSVPLLRSLISGMQWICSQQCRSERCFSQPDCDGACFSWGISCGEVSHRAQAQAKRGVRRGVYVCVRGCLVSQGQLICKSFSPLYSFIY